MSTSEGYPSSTPTEQLTDILSAPSPETFVRPQDMIASFETAKGSVYTYGEAGETTRFKTASGEQMEPQDITVFANLTLEQQQDVLAAYRIKNPIQKTKVYVVERQADNTPRIVRKVGDVERPEGLYLAIFRDGIMAENVPASLFPQVGDNVFDTRHYQQEDDTWMTERHLGNKVAKINYK